MSIIGQHFNTSRPHRWRNLQETSIHATRHVFKYLIHRYLPMQMLISSIYAYILHMPIAVQSCSRDDKTHMTSRSFFLNFFIIINNLLITTSQITLCHLICVYCIFLIFEQQWKILIMCILALVWDNFYQCIDVSILTIPCMVVRNYDEGHFTEYGLCNAKNSVEKFSIYVEILMAQVTVYVWSHCDRKLVGCYVLTLTVIFFQSNLDAFFTMQVFDVCMLTCNVGAELSPLSGY